MLKILMVLTMAAIIVSGVFGWKNREEFVNDRLAKQDYKNKIEKLRKDDAVIKDAIVRAHDQLVTAWGDRDIAKAQLDSAKQTLARTESEYASRNSEMERLKTEKEDKEKTLQEAEEAIRVALGRSIPLDQLEPGYNQLKQKVEDLKNKRTLVTNELNVNTETRNNRVTDRKQLQRAQSDRDKGFELNVFTAKVVNVRNEFGLLEFNAGSNQSISGGTNLMVVRNGIVLCQIQLVKAPTENRSLAEIKRDTLLEGVQVQVGDLVVVRTAKE